MVAKKIFLFFLLVHYVGSHAQIPIWQGFEMDWTYNHRINRLGSYVYQDSVFNTAATGLGKDSGWFKTHYLLLPEVGRQFNEIKVEKRIEAKEGELIQIQIDTILPISYHHSIFYLNGFDIIANNDADKLQLMQLAVKMMKGNFDTTYLRINISMMFNCQSIECDWINNDVEYDLNVFIGCISFPNEDYVSYSKMEIYNHQDTWSKKKPNNENCTMGENKYPNFMTDLKISLNKAHWCSGIKARIGAANKVCMQFEQYKPNMKKNTYYKPHANFSKKTKGTAVYEMTAIILTHPLLEVEDHFEYKGSIVWKGNNRSAFSRDAIKSTSIKQ